MTANQRSAKPDFQFRFAMIQVLLLLEGMHFIGKDGCGFVVYL
jgi:hypothetical protein